MNNKQYCIGLAKELSQKLHECQNEFKDKTKVNFHIYHINEVVNFIEKEESKNGSNA